MPYWEETLGRIAVIDDDKIIRGHIRNVLLSLGYAEADILEAYDGVSGMRALRQFHPAIVLTDMRMPHMDGLELIGAARSEWPWMQFIVLSNYDDFDYVRSSFQYNIVDYMLKYKLDSKQLEIVLAKARENLDLFIREDRRDARLKLLNHTDECLRRGQAIFADDSIAIAQLKLPDKPMELCIIHLVQIPGVGSQASVDRAAWNIARPTSELTSDASRTQHTAFSDTPPHFGDWKRELLETWLEAFRNDDADSFSLFAFMPPKRPTHMLLGVLSYKEYANYYAHRVWLRGRVDKVFSLAKAKGAVGLCVESSIRQYDAEAIRHSVRQSEYVFYSDDCGYLSEENGNSDENRGACPESIETRFYDSCIAGNEAEACAMLDEYTDRLRALRPQPEIARKAMWRLYTCVLREQPTLDGSQEMEPLALASQTLTAFYKEISRAAIECCTAHALHSGVGNSAIDRLISQITSNLSVTDESRQPVTLEQAASLTGYSRTHFCRIFRQYTGESFNAWLTRVRMERARQLLSVPGANVRTVSYLVGISDVRYFRKLFQKHTSLSVEEYMRKGTAGSHSSESAQSNADNDGGSAQ